jgi:hypothetical protein
MIWASAQWSNEGLLKMVNEKVPALIWNNKTWLVAEGAWDDNVSQSRVVQKIIEGVYHKYLFRFFSRKKRLMKKLQLS